MMCFLEIHKCDTIFEVFQSYTFNIIIDDNIFLAGDIMGPALSNMDSLVRMPTGCGEQNMVGFTPNIYVLKYLSSTGQLTDEIQEKAKHHMEIGMRWFC